MIKKAIPRNNGTAFVICWEQDSGTDDEILTSHSVIRELYEENEKLKAELKEPPHFSNVSGQVCAECKRKDEIIKWNRFYSDLRDKISCIHCEKIIPCEECKTYKELLKEHKLDAAQN